MTCRQRRLLGRVGLVVLLTAACADSAARQAPRAPAATPAGSGGEAADSGKASPDGTSPHDVSHDATGPDDASPSPHDASHHTTGPDAAGCNLDCAAGQHCERVQVQCVRAPCPPVPMCVEDPRPQATIDCDPKKVMCRRAPPVCPEGELPSVEGRCFGPCVRADSCACSQADECPNPDAYTCHLYAKRCGPYVR